MIYGAGRFRADWVGSTQTEVHCREAVSMRTAEWRTCLEGAQQRMRGLWEHRGGEEERGGKVVRTGSEGGERKRAGDARGSEVLCLWHGSRFREAGEDAQHGSVLSQETLVHPPQALDLSQSRESLHRGGQRDPERGRHTRHARRRDREIKGLC